jgi:eukaryotic-like serine/threonine-protein kinase
VYNAEEKLTTHAANGQLVARRLKGTEMNLKFLENLGSGGFGNVDLVEDESGAQYARKTFSVNQPLSDALTANVKKRFVREARAQSGFDHPRIVPILGGDLDADPPYFLMPVAITDLEKELAADPALDGNFKAAVMDIVAGLEEMHSVQMYHRDLKPQNVLKFENEGTPFYAISDFGFISIKDSTLSKLTTTGMVKGSDYYSAPEIVADLGKGYAGSDVFSLGCILHDMVGVDDRIPGREIKEKGEFGWLIRACTREDVGRRIDNVAAVRDSLVDVDASAIKISGEIGDIISQIFADPSKIDENDCRAFIEYLEDQFEDGNLSNQNSIFLNISLQVIQEFRENFPNSVNRLGVVYGQWVQEATLDWDTCDIVANRVAEFLSDGDFDLKAECLLGLINLGTSHNRWLVERMFMDFCGTEMDDSLAKRMAIEFRAIGTDLCGQLKHLEFSIGANRSSFHHRLQEAIASICG